MPTVNIDCYLIVKAEIATSGHQRGRASIRVAKGKPRLDSNEVAIKLNLQIPSALFTRPSITAEIKIPEDSAPFEITADVQDNIASAIKEISGLDVRLTVGVGDL